MKGPIAGKQPSGKGGNLRKPGNGKGGPRVTPFLGPMKANTPRAPIYPVAGKP